MKLPLLCPELFVIRTEAPNAGMARAPSALPPAVLAAVAPSEAMVAAAAAAADESAYARAGHGWVSRKTPSQYSSNADGVKRSVSRLRPPRTRGRRLQVRCFSHCTQPPLAAPPPSA